VGFLQMDFRGTKAFAYYERVRKDEGGFFHTFLTAVCGENNYLLYSVGMFIINFSCRVLPAVVP
jgi:hypothetical protein